jgi:6-phosphogluconolactonase
MSDNGTVAGAGSDDVRWISVADAVALQQLACRRISTAAAQAIEQRGRFLIVLAGGTTPSGVYRMLRATDSNWAHWCVYFGDERCGPPGDDAGASNSRMARETWLDHVPIPRTCVHPIPAELGAAAAAGVYAETLRDTGPFDLVLLGLGEDGHTASLFPGHDWGSASHAPAAIAVFDAPKPPAERVSLSAWRLSRARAVLFLVTGESKRRAVRQWRLGADIAARAIRPPSGVDVLVESPLIDADS